MHPEKSTLLILSSLASLTFAAGQAVPGPAVAAPVELGTRSLEIEEKQARRDRVHEAVAVRDPPPKKVEKPNDAHPPVSGRQESPDKKVEKDNDDVIEARFNRTPPTPPEKKVEKGNDAGV